MVKIGTIAMCVVQILARRNPDVSNTSFVDADGQTGFVKDGVDALVDPSLFGAKDDNNVDLAGFESVPEPSELIARGIGIDGIDGVAIHANSTKPGHGRRLAVNLTKGRRLAKKQKPAFGKVPGLKGFFAPANYKIYDNGYCLDQNLQDANVYMHPCHRGTNQQWFFDDQGRLSNLHSPNMCLDMNLQNRNLYMHSCHNMNNQKFVVENSMLKTQYDASLCADRHLENNNFYMHKCHGKGNQKLEIQGKIDIVAKWVPSPPYHIFESVSWSQQIGTSKTTANTRSYQWSTAVTAAASISMAYMGAGASYSVELSVSEGLTRTHSVSWSNSRTDSRTVVMEPLGDRKQHNYLWQFQYEISTDGVETCITKTGVFALTPGKAKPPRCYPGWNLGGDRTYQKCADTPFATLPQFRQPLSPCAPDNYPQWCPYWTKHGYCSKHYAQWMKINCFNSCFCS